MNNKITNSSDDNEMLPEYDFSGGVRGKHAESLRRGYRTIIHKADGSSEERDYVLPDGVVMLEPDVRTYFPDAESVNSALRGLIKLIPR